MSLTLTQKLDRFPPIACRLLARRRKVGGGFAPLTDHEIAAKSGLRLAVIKALSYEPNWSSIPVGQMLAFMRGCGIDLENRRTMWNNWRYLKERSFKYLTDDPEFETTFLPLCEEYQRQQSR